MALEVSPEVTVALPANGSPFAATRNAALEGLPLRLRRYAASADGLGGTISAAIADLEPGPSHLMILLPDLVGLTAPDLVQVFDPEDDTIRRGTAQDGRPGHPVVIPAWLFAAFANADVGDAGPRAVLKAHGVTPVALPGDQAVLDLDTPEDWADWRAGRRPTASSS